MKNDFCISKTIYITNFFFLCDIILIRNFERIISMKNIKINALASIMVNILNIVFPLITNPYLTRILSKDNYGYFNDASTWVNLVLPFAAFGIYSYGVRTISKVKDNKDEINYIFSKLFYISVLTSVFFTAIYFLTVQYVDIPNLKILYYILGFQSLFMFLNIEWMNEAYENYTFILYKTLFIRIVMLVSIFVFVKTEDDIVPYALIMTTTTILNYLLSFIWIKREVSFVKINIKEILLSTKSLTIMLLFANSNMLYTLLDRLYITKGNNVEYISYYTISMSIVMLISGVIVGVINVTIPRLGYYLGKKDYSSYNYLVNSSSSFFLFLMMPISIGLTVLGTYATVIYASDKYIDAGIVTSLFAIRTIVWAFEVILGKQIVFVNGYEHRLTSFYFIGGFLNIILNSALYLNNIYKPEFYIGTTILAELLVVILEIRFIQKYKLINLKPLFKTIIKYSAVSLGFIPIYFAFKYIFNINNYEITHKMIIMIVLVISCSGLYYITSLFIIKDQTIKYATSLALQKLKKK